MVGLWVLFAVAVFAETREYVFNVHEMEAAPDGYLRVLSVVNGQYPGPTVFATEGDTLHILVQNNLPYPTSFHWHGLYFTGINYMDGANSFVQCPIPPGKSFNYSFQVTQSGTYWWHSHVGGQLTDGLTGAIVLYEKNDPFPQAQNHILQVTDWYHELAGELTNFYMSPASEGNEPLPDSGLINGFGSYNCSGAIDPARCRSSRPLEAEYSVVFVEEGGMYRLRFINTGTYAMFKISIDNHNMTIVEVDGGLVEPLTVNEISLNTAQRISVLIEANQPPANYWIRASMQASCFGADTPGLNPRIHGILHYSTIPLDYPTTTGIEHDDCMELNLFDFHPSDFPEVPRNPVLTWNVTFLFANDASGVNLGYMNNITYSVPGNYWNSLEYVMNNETLPVKVNPFIVDVKPNSTIEIIINNNGNSQHPFHLHGHRLTILGQGQPHDGFYNSSIPLMDKPGDNPPMRDVYTIYAKSWLVARYFAVNPGVWAFHCHINWHVISGLVATIVELPAEIQKFQLPEEITGQCRYWE